MTNPDAPDIFPPRHPVAPARHPERSEGSKPPARQVPPDLHHRSLLRATARRYGRNPYVHAALMYPRRWTFRLGALWLLGYLALFTWITFRQIGYGMLDHARQIRQMLDTPIRPEGDAHLFGIMIFMFYAVFPGPVLLAIHAHLKTRLTDWTATVLPRHRAPHLFTGIIATLFVITFVNSIFYVLQPFSPAALFAAATTLAALAGWLAVLPPKAAVALAISAIAALAFKSVDFAIARMLLRQDPLGATISLALATLALAGVYVRLALLRDAPATPADEHLRLGTARIPRRHPGLSLDAMPARDRVALWRVPTSSGLLPAAAGAALFLLIVIVCLSQADRRREFVAVAIPLAALSMIVPVMAVGSHWLRRLPSLGYESTRPTTRPTFIKDLARSLAADWIAWWLPLTLGGIAGIVFALYWTLPVRYTPRFTGHELAYWSLLLLTTSASLQLLFIGLIAWTARFQTQWPLYTAVVASVISAVYLTALLANVARDRTPAEIAAALACPALAGLLLAADAYRRWLATDLH